MCDTDLVEKRKSPSKKQTPKKTKTAADEGGWNVGLIKYIWLLNTVIWQC